MNNNENKTMDNILLDSMGIPLDLTGLPADLTCNQEELKKWLDLDPPTDEEIEIMSAYFDSEKLKCGEYVPLPNTNHIETSETETTSLEMPENSVGKALLKGIFIAIAVQIAFHLGLSFFLTVTIVSILYIAFCTFLDSGGRKLHKK